MSTTTQLISNCLWFDSQAEEAATFYTSIFKNSSIGTITRFMKEGFEFHGKPEGSVMTVTFYLDGQEFMGLNGGKQPFSFNESLSLVIKCDTQEEIDHYWNNLTQGGQEQQCGWLKDKFGVSWQIVTTGWNDMINDPDKEKVKRVMNEVFKMTKPEIAVFEKAFNGN
jgi:predicted 3-demethylubiquinone-9 3-methyltransferase (glyoxalase superfamily)